MRRAPSGPSAPSGCRPIRARIRRGPTLFRVGRCGWSTRRTRRCAPGRAVSALLCFALLRRGGDAHRPARGRAGAGRPGDRDDADGRLLRCGLNASGPEIAGASASSPLACGCSDPARGATAWARAGRRRLGARALALARAGPAARARGHAAVIGARRPADAHHGGRRRRVARARPSRSSSPPGGNRQVPHGVGADTYANALKILSTTSMTSRATRSETSGRSTPRCRPGSTSRWGVAALGLLVLAAALGAGGAGGLAPCVVVAAGSPSRSPASSPSPATARRAVTCCRARVPPLNVARSCAAAGSRGCRSRPDAVGAGAGRRGSPTRAAPRSGPTARTGSSVMLSGRHRSGGGRWPRSPRRHPVGLAGYLSPRGAGGRRAPSSASAPR